MPDRKSYSQVKLRAKEHRKTPTPAEQIMWAHLRSRKLCGLKFRSHRPIGPYIADFYGAQHKLVVELDGGVHLNQAAYDLDRTAYLAGRGIQVLRVRNEMVENDMEKVMERIASACGVQRQQADGGGGVEIDHGHEP